MPIPFSGAARPLGAADLNYVATFLGCELAAVKAVLIVETGGVGGFLADGSGRPRILFESHLFSRATGGRYDTTNPDISVPAWDRRLYKGGAAEYLRLAKAVELDRKSALESTSWGMFQILGANAKTAGYGDVEAFVAAMATSEFNQLQAFGVFCQRQGLAAVLRAKDWETFARRYNGPQFQANQYDVKLARAYADALGTSDDDHVLRIGDRGPAVFAVQRALNGMGYGLAEDSAFGRATEIAVQKFQSIRKLTVDGVVGPVTARALGVA